MNKKTTNILDRIQHVLSEITPKQKRLAEYILDNYKKAAFLNSTDLAKAAGVSGSTVVRFAEIVDYSGFPEMQSALHSIVQMEINALDMFSENFETNIANDYEKTFRQGAEDLVKISKSISNDSFNTAVDLIKRQQKVYIAAFQASACLADYTSYALGKVRPEVHNINKWDESLFNHLCECTEKDVLLLYAFPRFPDLSLKVAKYFSEKNVPIIYVTSNAKNPISEFASTIIQLKIKYTSYIDDLGPAIYLAKAIISAVARDNTEQATSQLTKFEYFAQKNQIFCK